MMTPPAVRAALLAIGALVTLLYLLGLWAPAWSGTVSLVIVVAILLLIFYLVSGKAE